MTKICRLCLSHIPNYKEDILNKTKVKVVIPEIDITITKSIALCNLCLLPLDAAYEFKKRCLKSEEELKRYITDCALRTPIDLNAYKAFEPEVKSEIIKIKDDKKTDILEEKSPVVITCDTCNSSFNHKEAYDAHKEVCVLFNCNECRQGFPTNEAKQEHFAKHMSLNRNKCPHCSVSLATETDLSAHFLSAHSPLLSVNNNSCDKPAPEMKSKVNRLSPKLHTCSVCNKRFLRKQGFDTHMEIHNDKKLICEVCGESQPGMLTMKRHMWKHKNPFTCATCSKTCTSKYWLIEHIRSHTGEKPYWCENCGGTQCGNLMKHRRTVHNIKKPYVCDHCGKAFRLQSNLKKHMTKHPNKIAVCKFAHSTNYMGNVHLSNHRGTKICGLCGLAFHSKYELKLHMRIV